MKINESVNKVQHNKKVRWHIFSNFNGISPLIKAMHKTALDRYEEIVTDALKITAKVRKSFKTAIIMTLILYMVISKKIDFKQMGRYSQSSSMKRGLEILGIGIVDVDARDGVMPRVEQTRTVAGSLT